MGLFKTIAIVVISISLFVFIALFGRLPVFRKTPIGLLHRIIMKHIPAGFIKVDTAITGGRFSRSLHRTFHYLMFEKHPAVLIFFVLLQVIGEILFIPFVLPTLPIKHYFITTLLISLPYIFLYYCATTTSSISIPDHITSQPPTSGPPPSLDFGPSHRRAMHAYPYDFHLFHPGYFCSTCHVPKPARSKHCSLCRACVEKQDHHCVWVNNCVGRNNHLHFLLLIISTWVLLIYGSWLGYGYLWDAVQTHVVPPALTRGSVGSKRWDTGLGWWKWMNALLWAFSRNACVGGVTFLTVLCVPLAAGFAVYHLYLIWAGMTTNESAKWSDWKEDVKDGLVWRARMDSLRRKGEFEPLPREVEPRDEDIEWPMVGRRKGSEMNGGVVDSMWKNGRRRRAEWWYIRTRDGGQPTRKDGSLDDRWEKVKNWKDVENMYDLGWWENLMEAIYYRD